MLYIKNTNWDITNSWNWINEWSCNYEI